jgi:hypothetical protein
MSPSIALAGGLPYSYEEARTLSMIVSEQEAAAPAGAKFEPRLNPNAKISMSVEDVFAEPQKNKPFSSIFFQIIFSEDCIYFGRIFFKKLQYGAE